MLICICVVYVGVHVWCMCEYVYMCCIVYMVYVDMQMCGVCVACLSMCVCAVCMVYVGMHACMVYVCAYVYEGTLVCAWPGAESIVKCLLIPLSILLLFFIKKYSILKCIL